MSDRNALVMLLLLPFLAACPRTSPEALTGDCELGAPAAVAKAKAGPQPDGSVVLINGRRIKPAGDVQDVGTFAIGAALSPQGILAVSAAGKEDLTLPERTGRSDITADWQAIDLFDTATGSRLATLPVQSNFVGLAWHPAGTTLYVAGGGRDLIRRIHVDAAHPTTPAVEGPVMPVFGYPTGLAFDAASDTLFATLLHRHAVVALDPQTGAERRRWKVEAAPYQVELAPDGRRAYVSNWSSDTLSVLDLVGSEPVRNLKVGKNPTGIAVSADGKRVFVAASDADVVAVIDTATWSVTPWSLKASPDDPEGISPTDLRLSPDGRRLHVVAAAENAVLVLDASSGRRIGAVPTAQYPTEVEIDPSGNRLHIVSAKGYGAGPNLANEFVGAIIRGTVQSLATPTDAELVAMDAEVRAMNDVMANIYSPACRNVRHPVPLAFGQRSQVIEHVVYIMRENKTYDSLLGDLGPAADGDPDLVVFGEEITPNLHRLARRFGNLTNFYNESEQSVQGHIWGSAGVVNDFAEKTWIAMWGRPNEAQVIVPGMEPGTIPKRGDMFQYFVRQGRSVRNHGEYMGVVLDAMGVTTGITNTKFAAYFGVDDSRKVQDFIHELNTRGLPDFTFLMLGNDHTLGLRPGAPTPEYMIADNDWATGLAIEAISKSPYWKKTVIFIFEDDPQGNADHVDAHRSINIVVSPWVKRGALSRVAHSFPSMHKTAHLLLGVPPMSRHFQVAAGIYEVFGTGPANAEPYEAVRPDVPYAVNPSIRDLEAAGRHDLAELARESERMDFSAYDKAPTLGRVLWQYRKGTPFPAHLAVIEEEAD